MPQKRISLFRQLFPSAPNWSVDDVPDQAGKVVIITGGCRGVGKETARELLSKGAKVYIAARSEDDGQRAIEELRQGGKEKASVFFLRLDLGDLLSVKAAAEEFISKESELHTLYNNDGVMYSPVDKLTSQNYDLQFGTNVLGHFYFTKLLLPVLKATAEKAPAKTVRVVNVSSLVHYWGSPKGIEWNTLKPGAESLEARKKLGSARLYGQSKTGNILFSNELARQYGPDGIVSISINVGTDLARHAGSFVGSIGRMCKYAWFYVMSCGEVNFLTAERNTLTETATRTATQARDNAADATTQARDHIEEAVTNIGSGEASEMDGIELPNTHGAITCLFAGTSPQAGDYNGKYITSWTRLSLPHAKARNTYTEKTLWDWCEDQVNDIGKADS